MEDSGGFHFKTWFQTCNVTQARDYVDLLKNELKALEESSSRIDQVTINIMNEQIVEVYIHATDLTSYKTAISAITRYIDIISRTFRLTEQESPYK
nr:hypothetical protein [Candidatus Sigynarchaeota archaeon]